MKHVTLALILLAGMFFGVSASSLNSELYMKYVGQADSLVNAERWEEAESCLRLALHAEPANPGNQLLLTNMGMILTAQGKYGEAISHLDAALSLNPRSFLALKRRGIAYLAMRQMEDAAADFSKALAIDSLDTDVRCLRATVYACSDNSAGAMADYNRVLAIDRNNATALEGMATSLLAKGSHDEAIPFLNRLIEQKPESDHLFTRGLAYARLGRLTEASEDASEGLLMDPSNGNLWLLKAYIEKITYRINEAKESLRKANRYGCDRELEYQLLPDL